MKKTTKKIWVVAIVTTLLFPIIALIMAEYIKRKKQNVGSDTARGIRNNNPLNLRRTGINWKGEKPEITDPDFEEFESVMWGLRAGLRNMRTKINQGYKTLGSLISVWAPPTENKTSSYIGFVSKETGLSATTELKFERDFMFPIVKAMCKLESKIDLTPELYEEAWQNI